MHMLNLNETAALQLVFQFINVKQLLVAAMTGFAESDTPIDKDNADLCNKALYAFLK